MINVKSFETREQTYAELKKLTTRELRFLAQSYGLVVKMDWTRPILMSKILWFGRLIPMSLEKFSSR